MTVYAHGIDYAWAHPDPGAIKAAGYDFVVRYYSRDPSKNLTRAEADALTAAGLWIVGNWEHTAQDALGGYAAGVAIARLARQLADACGQPTPRPIYESDDWDVTPAQEATITDYLRGWDSVIGVAQVGEYAGFYPLRAQRDAGVTSWEWQPRAWSGGRWEPRVNIVQTGTAMVGGVQVDVNEAWTADYGQWQPGRLPFPSPVQEDTMQALYAVGNAPDGSNPGIWFWRDGRYGYVGSIPERDLIVSVFGVQETPLPHAAHQVLLGLTAAPAVALTDAQIAAIAAQVKVPTKLTLTGTEQVTETGELS
jgi:hypothetical protein